MWGACNIDSLFCYLLWEYAGEDLSHLGGVLARFASSAASYFQGACLSMCFLGRAVFRTDTRLGKASRNLNFNSCAVRRGFSSMATLTLTQHMNCSNVTVV